MKVPPRRYAAIVRRARAGEPYAEIAKRFGLSAKYVNEIGLREGIRRHAPSVPLGDHTVRLCAAADCETPTRSQTGLCVTCYREGITDGIGLENGAWRFNPFRRRWEWVPDRVEPVAAEPTDDMCTKCGEPRSERNCRRCYKAA